MTVRLAILDGGWVYTRGVRFTNAAGEEETRDFRDPNHCYLIEHPRGRLLWDTGLSDEIAAFPQGTLKRGRFRFRVTRPLADQLAVLGVAPEAIDYVAYSHLQIDHAGNAGLFPRSCVLAQQAELDLAFGPEAGAWGYRLEDYQAIAGGQVRPLAGDLDLFGDGRVMLLSAPGHTPGHQVLFVDLPGGPVLLSGDLYYQEKDPAVSWMPYWNYDKPQTLESMRRLETFAAERGARWIINHDRAQRKTLPLAPAWLE